jgi:hypothetical protein
MPSVIVSRSDLFPVGTTVGIYPGTSRPPDGDGPPGSAVIASAAVAAGGSLTVTNAGILQGVDYVAYAKIGNEHRYVKVRSSLDISGLAGTVGTGDTTSGSAALANVSASSGAFAIGQRIEGPGIPAGTFLIAGSGASWTMSAKATASASGVALGGHGAYPAAVPANLGSGALARPVAQTKWQAKVMQRRSILGTS